MIGRATGTGTGKVTWEGSAKPEDPIFKEGWSVSVQPQSGRKLSEPSSGETNETDAIRDAISGKEIRCPYCASTQDCQHRLALINWNFPDCPSGQCAERFDEYRELVKTAFVDRFQSGAGMDSLWGDPVLDELWQYAFDYLSDGDRSVRWDEVVFTGFVTDLFVRAGGEKYPGSIENCLGPGLASVWTMYYAENPAVVLDAALSELKKLLMTTGREAVDVSRPSKRKQIARGRKRASR